MKILWWFVFLAPALYLTTSNCAQEPAPFDLSGFTTDEIFAVSDELPLLATDPNVQRLLDRAAATSAKTLRKFNRFTTNPSIELLNQSPRDFRCHAIKLTGIARLVLKVQPDMAEQRFFALSMKGDNGNDCVVCLNQIPKNWPLGEPIAEPITIVGFYLANFDMVADASTDDQITFPNLTDNAPVLIANRVQWFPNRSSSQIPVKPSQILLAQHGVDIAQLQQTLPSGGLTAQDATLFYQLLRACQQINSSEADASTSFTDCLKNPGKRIGEALQFTGQLRSATRIKIEDAEIMELLGQDHYYQLVVFAPLNQQQIVIRNPDNITDENSKSPTIVHDNRYPIVVCTPQLPASESEISRQQVTLSGFFMKLWNYESGHSEFDPSAPKQISPLVIAVVPKIILPPSNPLNFWIGAAAVLGLVGVSLLFWFMTSDAAKSRSPKSDKSSNLPDQIEFPSID